MVNIVQTYRTNGYFNGNPFSDRCHTHVLLTLLMGMLAVRFTKRKYLMALSIIIPHFAMECLYGVFPYRSFAYIGNIRPDLSDIHGNLMGITTINHQ